jgi:hypothetical protein
VRAKRAQGLPRKLLRAFKTYSDSKEPKPEIATGHLEFKRKSAVIASVKFDRDGFRSAQPPYRSKRRELEPDNDHDDRQTYGGGQFANSSQENWPISPLRGRTASISAKFILTWNDVTTPKILAANPEHSRAIANPIPLY